MDLSNDKMALQRLKRKQQKAKKSFLPATTTNINLPFITATADGPKHLDMNLTRAKFDELDHDLVGANSRSRYRTHFRMRASQHLNWARCCW